MTDEPEYLTPLQREYMARNPDVTVSSDDAYTKASLVGVHGWLRFLAITLVVLGPLTALASTATEISMTEAIHPAVALTTKWQILVPVTWAISALYCSISIYAGWRLFQRHVPSTVPIVIACLWISGPGLSIIMLFVIGALLGYSGAVEAGPILVRPLVYSAIWTAYLIQSKRVENTYRRNSDVSPGSEIA